MHQLLLASWEVARLRQGVNEPAKRACRSSRLRLSTSSSSSRRSIVWPMLARSSFSSRASSVWVMPGLRKISQYTPLRPREPELFNRRIGGPAQTPGHFLHKKEQPIGIGEGTCPPLYPRHSPSWQPSRATYHSGSGNKAVYCKSIYNMRLRYAVANFPYRGKWWHLHSSRSDRKCRCFTGLARAWGRPDPSRMETCHSRSRQCGISSDRN